MATYLIAAENPEATSFTSVIRELGGQFLHSSFGIVPWPDTAEALCRRLEPVLQGHLAVCSVDSADWSYR